MANDGEGESGKYLIRKKPKTENSYILSVIYKGKPSHHTIERESDGAEMTLNKNPTGCTTLSEVCSSPPPAVHECVLAAHPGTPVPTATCRRERAAWNQVD